jgi:hypothetical protein
MAEVTTTVTESFVATDARFVVVATVQMVLSTDPVWNWKPLYLGKIAFDLVGTRRCNIFEVGLQILVDACSMVIKTKVWRQVAVVILKSEQIHLGLEQVTISANSENWMA